MNLEAIVRLSAGEARKKVSDALELLIDVRQHCRNVYEPEQDKLGENIEDRFRTAFDELGDALEWLNALSHDTDR